MINNYTLNEVGQKALLSAIVGLTTHKLSNPEAYFVDAEESADLWNAGEDASIEIEGIFTQSGNPELIKLKKEWFNLEGIQ